MLGGLLVHIVQMNLSYTINIGLNSLNNIWKVAQKQFKKGTPLNINVADKLNY